jgi:glycosyltransferase involved in cell wall biosynthesis
VPVVATPVGGIRETVVPGETGTLVPVDDPKALADGIVWVLEHRAEALEMAEKARRQVRSRYSIERMVEETLRVYDGARASAIR